MPVILTLVGMVLAAVMALAVLWWVQRATARRDAERMTMKEMQRKQDMEMARQYEEQQRLLMQSGQGTVAGGTYAVGTRPGSTWTESPAELRVREKIDAFISQFTEGTPGAAPSGEMDLFPPGSTCSGVKIEGDAVTVDFSTELLKRRDDLEFWEHMQMALIKRVGDVEPTLKKFHVRITGEDGTPQLLEEYLKIPAERKPKAVPAQPVDGG